MPHNQRSASGTGSPGSRGPSPGNLIKPGHIIKSGTGSGTRNQNLRDSGPRLEILKFVIRDTVPCRLLFIIHWNEKISFDPAKPVNYTISLATVVQDCFKFILVPFQSIVENLNLRSLFGHTACKVCACNVFEKSQFARKIACTRCNYLHTLFWQWW